MRPVYGIIEPNGEVNVCLLYNGCRLEESRHNCPRRRFTIVIAIAPHGDHINVQKLFRETNSRGSPRFEVVKKRIEILFNEYKSAETIQKVKTKRVEDPDDDDLLNVPKARIRKRRGVVEDDVEYHHLNEIEAKEELPENLCSDVKNGVLCGTQEDSVSGQEFNSKSESTAKRRVQRNEAPEIMKSFPLKPPETNLNGSVEKHSVTSGAK